MSDVYVIVWFVWLVGWMFTVGYTGVLSGKEPSGSVAIDCILIVVMLFLWPTILGVWFQPKEVKP